MTALTILDRVLGPLADCLTAEDVQRVNSLPPDPVLESRIEELAGKANEGQLTSEEHHEYETYIDATDFIALLLARARARLK